MEVVRIKLDILCKITRAAAPSPFLSTSSWQLPALFSSSPSPRTGSGGSSWLPSKCTHTQTHARCYCLENEDCCTCEHNLPEHAARSPPYQLVFWMGRSSVRGPYSGAWKQDRWLIGYRKYNRFSSFSTFCSNRLPVRRSTIELFGRYSRKRRDGEGWQPGLQLWCVFWCLHEGRNAPQAGRDVTPPLQQPPGEETNSPPVTDDR